jgi:hypothetical protein
VNEALARHNVWGDAELLEHAKTCDVCTRELAVLKKRREFRDAFPVLSSIADEAEGGRARPVVVGSETKQRATRRHLVIMTAAVFAIVFYYVQNRALHPPPRTTPVDTSGPPRFRIYNLENAVFESKVEGATVRSSQTQGLAAYYVDQMGQNQRFLLTLPDGDLEVKGTRFVVAIEGGKTKSVEVAQGKVALHLDGHEEVILSGGERWPRGSGAPTVSFIEPPTKDASPREAPKPSH